MKLRKYLYLALLFFSLTSCEDVLEIDLNEADARVVIEAQLNDLSTSQQIRISQTVPFAAAVKSKAITDAQVIVTDNQGRTYAFRHQDDGMYSQVNFLPVAGRTYKLEVRVGEALYEANCTMPAYVAVDSVGVIKEKIFKDDYYFATFKFNDPAEQENYYKYDLAIQKGALKFAAVFNDKFNDGRYVTHQIGDRDEDIFPGDSLTVRRYCVDKAVYKFWNEFQMTNPGSAAPANPSSNISNHALGYFSVASAKEYVLLVTDIEND